MSNDASGNPDELSSGGSRYHKVYPDPHSDSESASSCRYSRTRCTGALPAAQCPSDRASRPRTRCRRGALDAVSHRSENVAFDAFSCATVFRVRAGLLSG
jgi:hypothetical protein